MRGVLTYPPPTLRWATPSSPAVERGEVNFIGLF